MSSNIVELAKKYYPTLWSLNYINILLQKNKITAGEYYEITGIIKEEN